jgi:hypothetical protein
MLETTPDPHAGLDGLLERLASLAEDSQSPESTALADHGYMVPDPPTMGTGCPVPRRALTRDDELRGQDSATAPQGEQAFFPAAPANSWDTHVEEREIEGIVLRILMYQGTSTGVDLSRQIGLPFPMTERLLHALKLQRMLIYKSRATLTDYVYEITEFGLQRARESAVDCKYCGTVPVSLADYVKSVAAQSISRSRPRPDNVYRAFADLTISREMLLRLGRAVASGRGLFLHGSPGNGKTSIAERITAVYGTSIWIPRAISAFGEVISLFDPSCHEELPLMSGDQIVDEEKIDHRWVRIRRPTIVVGGELTMANLEVTTNRDTGISEAPIQMKSNGGTLVIDDFGRQRETPQKLLNRWIVPLEKREDYLGLGSGRKICVPFDQFIVFSTNLEPKDLVDEAFLRRIPHKIEVPDPTVEQFRHLFEEMCAKQGIVYETAALDHLMARHYESTGRPMRFCHPRDLLHQVSVFCRFRGLPPAMSAAALEAAATDYFSVMGR